MAKQQYFYGTGKRKTSIARVRLLENGNGTITVNEHPIQKYFPGSLPERALAPLNLTNTGKSFDIVVHIQGGGKNSQSEAMRHGISRALLLFDPAFRTALKKAGFLTRDARIRERKKPGLKRARRAPQWCKR
jgi:small subunit ribosomal protein S9